MQLEKDEGSNLDAFAKAKLVIGFVSQVEEMQNSDKLFRWMLSLLAYTFLWHLTGQSQMQQHAGMRLLF